MEGRGDDTSRVAIAVEVMGGYCPLLGAPEVVSCLAKIAKTLKSRMPTRLYSANTLLERLAQDLEDMAAELGPFIQEEHAMVGQRHVTRQRHVAPRRSALHPRWNGAGCETGESSPTPCDRR